MVKSIEKTENGLVIKKDNNKTIILNIGNMVSYYKNNYDLTYGIIEKIDYIKPILMGIGKLSIIINVNGLRINNTKETIDNSKLKMIEDLSLISNRLDVYNYLMNECLEKIRISKNLVPSAISNEERKETIQLYENIYIKYEKKKNMLLIGGKIQNKSLSTKKPSNKKLPAKKPLTKKPLTKK